MLIRFFRKSEASISNYLEFRRKAIEAKDTDIIPTRTSLYHDCGEGQPCAVFAVLCDYNVSSAKTGEQYFSLACFSSGVAELFYSKSGMRVIPAQRADEIGKACFSLLKSTEKMLGLFKKTEDFFLPEKENARIYAITNKGVYMVEYSLDFVWTHDENLSRIRNLSDEIIAFICDKKQETLATIN